MMATVKKPTYVAEGQQAECEDADLLAYPDDQSDYDMAASEPRCTTCGELLAWHEEACNAAPQPGGPVAAAPEMQVASQAYAYNVGHLVQPVPEAAAWPIIWRGQLRERHPRTGLVHRVNVYRLADGYWDCYREEELRAA